MADQETVIVTQEKYLDAIDDILNSTDLQTIKDYLTLQVVWNTASALSQELDDTAFDFYVDIGGGSAGVHRLVGTFTTDGLGNGTLTGSIVVSTVASTLDNELIQQGENPSNHQYIRELFAPCLELWA